MVLTKRQVKIIRCAYLDLKGAEEAKKVDNYGQHDWQAHRQSIEELEEEFDFLFDLV